MKNIEEIWNRIIDLAKQSDKMSESSGSMLFIPAYELFWVLDIDYNSEFLDNQHSRPARGKRNSWREECVLQLKKQSEQVQ